MSRLLIRTLSAQTFVFISHAFAVGVRDSYKDTNSGKENEGTIEWKILYL